MAKNNLYAEGGGASFYAPHAVALTQEEFIAKYIDSIQFFATETERKKFLTSKYKECQDIMNPPKYKGVTEKTVEEKSEPIEAKEESPIKKTNKKTEVKKE